MAVRLEFLAVHRVPALVHFGETLGELTDVGDDAVRYGFKTRGR